MFVRAIYSTCVCDDLYHARTFEVYTLVTPPWKVLRNSNLRHSAPLEMLFQMKAFVAKVKIFIFCPKTMDYSPWFDFWESEKSLEKRIPSERASQEEQNGTNLSFVAPSSEELLSVFKGSTVYIPPSPPQVQDRQTRRSRCMLQERRGRRALAVCGATSFSLLASPQWPSPDCPTCARATYSTSSTPWMTPSCSSGKGQLTSSRHTNIVE